MAGIQAGARVDTDKYDKENARDFVLWKFKSDEPAWAQWDAPFGQGRPGWHIECSAMSMKYLGETFDLHAGGEDLIFPHHENEIAQSSGGDRASPSRVTGCTCKHLLVDNETMSKSKGNFFTIPDLLEKGHSRGGDPLPARRLPLPEAAQLRLRGPRSTRRRPWSACTGSPRASARWAARAQKGRRPKPARRRAGPSTMRSPMTSTRPRRWPRSTASWDARTACSPRGPSTRSGAERVLAELRAMDAVFGTLLPAGAEDRLSAEEQALFDERQEARRRREFARADAARARLEALGVVLEDTPKGTRWRRKK